MTLDTVTEPLPRERATHPIVVAGTTYTTHEPKLLSWSGAARLAKTIKDGTAVDLDTVTGLFVRLIADCLTPADRAAFLAELYDPTSTPGDLRYHPDSAVDLEDLWHAGLEVIAAYQPLMEARGRALGMKLPKLSQLPTAGSPAAPAAPRVKAPARKKAARR